MREESGHLGLSEQLNLIRTRHPDFEVSLGELMDTLGEKGFGIVIVLVAMPSALPVPAVGYGTFFGFLLLILGGQLFLGRAAPWLPDWARRRRFPKSLTKAMIDFGEGFFRRFEWLIRPRLHWLTGRTAGVVMGGVVAIMSILMMIPLPGTNTFPAFVIFLIGVGLTEEDGLFIVGASALGVITSIAYGVLFTLVAMFGLEVIDQIKDAIKAAIF